MITMTEIRHQLRHALPLWGIGLITDFWPDNRASCRVRGTLMRPFLGNCGRGFSLGKHVTLNSPDRLRIGSRCYFAKGTWIQAMGTVTMEDEVVCGPYVVIASTNHGFINGSTVGGGTHPAPVYIGRGTWLGAHAVVTAGVTIGRGNLIGAGAVVTRDTPDNVIVGGIPAKVLGPREDNCSSNQRRPDVDIRCA